MPNEQGGKAERMIKELAICGLAIMFTGTTIAVIIAIIMYKHAGSEENK